MAKKQAYDTNSLPPVSIIICAKNEAANLLKNLPSVIGQTYPMFELIVVNDNSDDDTERILLDFSAKTKYFRMVNNNNNTKGQLGKKFALSKGIEAAQYDLILLTDADCRPNSQKWLYHMQSVINNNIEIALGYGPYEKASGWLNKFIRFETVYTAIQYFSFALSGSPYMGVGRNLMYKKKLFEQVNGFSKHEHIASGDDDLFINEVATQKNVTIVLDEKTFVYSEAKNTWSSYYRQKRRHLTTGTHYLLKHQFLLGLLSVSHFLHYTAGIVLILKFSTIFVLFIYVVRLFVVLLVYAATLKKLRELDLLFWIPILDAAYILYYAIFWPTLMFGKTKTWK
jgi:cellulose synthase/poly-beta-1,6-N-acetylglucosamine synthase-like glycosyltransferase